MKSTPPKSRSRQSLLVGGILVGVLVIVVALYTLASNTRQNYAEEVARPLKTALVKAGAIEKCSNGDDGRGSDNKTPWYGATFAVPKSKEDAVRIAIKAASESGYTLTHANLANRGFLSAVADEYIDNWYFDENSRSSSYSDLNPGKIKLSMVIYGEGEKTDCDQSIIQPGNSTIGLGVTLPNFK